VAEHRRCVVRFETPRRRWNALAAAQDSVMERL